MKTNVIMKRQMGDFDVFQRTKDGMFNATGLINQWNGIKGNTKRDLSKFWESKKVKEFIEVLEHDLWNNDLHTPKMPYVKSKASRGLNAGTWMHPFLFIKLAMWINPKFELEVIKFVYDQLLEFRDMAGDLYKDLTKAVAKFHNVNYSQLAKGLNYIVFGRHESGIRQTAPKDELTAMNDLQKKLAFAIEMDYIRNFEELINEMRRLFNINQFKMLD